MRVDRVEIFSDATNAGLCDIQAAASPDFSYKAILSIRCACALTYVKKSGVVRLPTTKRMICGTRRRSRRRQATLITTARMNDVDPQVWLADVLTRVNDHNIQDLYQLLPWKWKLERAALAA